MPGSRSKHELKTCPRCGRSFECRLNDPVQCDCARLQLSAETLSAIRGRFQDCLCLTCLTALAAGAGLEGTGGAPSGQGTTDCDDP